MMLQIFFSKNNYVTEDLLEIQEYKRNPRILYLQISCDVPWNVPRIPLHLVTKHSNTRLTVYVRTIPIDFPIHSELKHSHPHSAVAPVNCHLENDSLTSFAYFFTVTRFALLRDALALTTLPGW